MANQPAASTRVRLSITQHIRALEVLEPRRLLHGVAFEPQQVHGVGDSPYAVAAADLNHDGAADLVSANYGSNDVSVLLGRGDGTFRSAQSFAVDDQPHAVAIADLNCDGNLDIATASFGPIGDGLPGSVSVLLGNGNGTFQARHSFETDTSPVAIVLADLNHDGKLDAATANENRSTISVLIGTGDGRFEDQHIYDVVDTPHAIAVGDFNGDSNADLATDGIGMLLSRGDGGFQVSQRIHVPGAPFAVAVADLNADGLADIITGDASDGSSGGQALLGNGNATFQTPRNFGAGNLVSSVGVGDFDLDGQCDVVTVSWTGAVSVALGQGDGTFARSQTFGAGVHPWGSAVADLNGDGRPDVVTANRDSNNLSVLLNTPVLPPAVVSESFDFDAPQQQVAMRFSTDVSDSIEASDLILKNLTTGSTVASASIDLFYDAPTDIYSFKFRFPLGVLPDGNYRAILPADSVSDSLGNGLAADVTFDFFVLNGDANRDRRVDVADLGIVATNWHLPNRTLSRGDFTYDGKVDFYDLGVIGKQWQKTLPPSVQMPIEAGPVLIPTTKPARHPFLLDDVSPELNS